MLNSINIGTSGLIGSSKELETISNNVANLNTAGFKGSNSQFAALVSEGGGSALSGQSGSRSGAGLGMLSSVIDFSQGQVNQTGNDLDVAIDGSGFFVLRDTTGQTFYSRNGQFKLDAEGFLVSSITGNRVQALSDQGVLTDISVKDLRTNAASASTKIDLAGTLSTADATKTVSGITVTDNAGGTHVLSVKLTNNTAITPGSWLVTILDGTTTVASGEIRYASGLLDPAFDTVTFNYSPAGAAAMPLTLTIDAGSTSAASGSSTMAASSVDGYGVGQMTGTTVDTSGHLVVSYSNGQTDKSQTLAIALFDSTDDLQATSGIAFKTTNTETVTLGVAKAGTSTIDGGSLEGSNVDLSKEFSKIIITQRGYQAASELISTANQMLQTLIQMKGQN